MPQDEIFRRGSVNPGSTVVYYITANVVRFHTYSTVQLVCMPQISDGCRQVSKSKRYRIQTESQVLDLKVSAWLESFAALIANHGIQRPEINRRAGPF